jgi:hypothetical protein
VNAVAELRDSVLRAGSDDVTEAFVAPTLVRWRLLRPDGKTDVDEVVVRHGKNLKGHVLAALFTVIGKRFLGRAFSNTIKASKHGTTGRTPPACRNGVLHPVLPPQDNRLDLTLPAVVAHMQDEGRGRRPAALPPADTTVTADPVSCRRAFTGASDRV